MKTVLRRQPAKFNNFPSILDELFFNDSVKNNFTKETNPLVNIKETESEFEIQLSIPGYNKEDISINVENELLTIASEKEHSEIKENEKFTMREFSFKKFKRSFTLPEIVDVDAIEAKNENGILFIKLPKNKALLESKVKSIAIS